MNTYAYASGVAALMALSGAAGGSASAVYLRPLQPPQQQTATVPPPAPVQTPAPAIRTLSWFMAHDAERAAKMAACADNPGVARLGDPECDNAFNARDRLNYRASLKSKEQ